MSRLNCGDEIGGRLALHSQVQEKDGFVLMAQVAAALWFARQTAACLSEMKAMKTLI